MCDIHNHEQTKLILYGKILQFQKTSAAIMEKSRLWCDVILEEEVDVCDDVWLLEKGISFVLKSAASLWTIPKTWPKLNIVWAMLNNLKLLYAFTLWHFECTKLLYAFTLWHFECTNRPENKTDLNTLQLLFVTFLLMNYYL